jgi:hypothetical protein
MKRTLWGIGLIALAACSQTPAVAQRVSPASAPDTLAISSIARDLSSDANRGRGPWTPENERVARQLAARLQALGARPVFGGSLLVPFTTAQRPRDTVYNVIGVLPGRGGSTTGESVAMTAHLDHLGVGKPDAFGDSIYNGFLDDAVSIAMILDLSRRWVASPGRRPLIIMFFNLEEQGLLGAKALAARSDASVLFDRLGLLVGVDAGSPAGEAMAWQLMGAQPPSVGSRIADSLARAHGWTTTSTPPRAINDVYVLAQRDVPIVFPIPGSPWRGYTAEQRAEALRRFDHYHQPADQWRADFPWTGTAIYAEWLWEIVKQAADTRTALR